MINGKMWLVVKPTVGIPLIIGGVALTALAVHASILTHTTWFAAYWQGKGTRAAAAAPDTSSLVALMKPGTTEEYARLASK
ncbi:light-harvesting protein [Sediminicoccus sp. KRV36]|uniref:light-harvesting protein n=1 Tax=Sediminicoccus sp. KRV36 TaxID=3133721 RepID=UPI00200C33C4|nr:light-harvesting protein [Sediminicoccus rosea]UPY36216.1 light-harvesting protein [Sediminicoccus rosea]